MATPREPLEVYLGNGEECYLRGRVTVEVLTGCVHLLGFTGVAPLRLSITNFLSSPCIRLVGVALGSQNDGALPEASEASWLFGPSAATVKEKYLKGLNWPQRVDNSNYGIQEFSANLSGDANTSTSPSNIIFEKPVKLRISVHWNELDPPYAAFSHTPPVLPHLLTNEWERVRAKLLDCLHKPELHREPVVLTWADKGYGKSTFHIWLINSLLAFVPKVALLDIDLGQPLLHPPGLVSLSYLDKPILQEAHACRPPPDHQSSFGGGTTITTNPDASLVAIHEYVRIWKMRNSSHFATPKSPLVVNSHGWTQGLGRYVLNSLKRQLSSGIAVGMTRDYLLHCPHVVKSTTPTICSECCVKRVQHWRDSDAHSQNPESLSAALGLHKPPMDEEKFPHWDHCHVVTHSVLAKVLHDEGIQQLESTTPAMPHELRRMRFLAYFDRSYQNAIEVSDVEEDELFYELPTNMDSSQSKETQVVRVSMGAHQVYDYRNYCRRYPSNELSQVMKTVVGQFVALLHVSTDSGLANCRKDWIRQIQHYPPEHIGYGYFVKCEKEGRNDEKVVDLCDKLSPDFDPSRFTISLRLAPEFGSADLRRINGLGLGDGLCLGDNRSHRRIKIQGGLATGTLQRTVSRRHNLQRLELVRSSQVPAESEHQ